MKTAIQLKSERTAKIVAQRALVNKAKAENREMTVEENAAFDALQDEADGMEADIQRAEKFEKNELLLAGSPDAIRLSGGGEGGEKGEKKKIKKRFSILKAIREGAAGKLEGIEKEMHEEAVAEARGLKIEMDETQRSVAIPAMMIRATSQTVTQDAGEYGGQLVASTPKLIDGFMPQLFLEKMGATFMPGLVGNVPLPTAKNYEFSWVGENAAVTKQKQKFDGPILKPKRAAAAVGISNQLLLQTSPGVDKIIWDKLREGAARAINSAAINGDGILEPLGILNTPGIKLPANVTAGVATWNKVVLLKTLIEAADATMESRGYLLSPSLAGALETIKKDAGSGRFLMEEGKINGAIAAVTSLVETLGGNEVLLYGDFSQLFIGQWGGVQFTLDPYTGAGSAELLTYVNMFADVQIANPAAFSADKFLTL